MANSVPTLAGLNSPTPFLENTVNATPQLIDANVTLTDRDGTLASGTLSVTGLLPEDLVSIRNVGTGAGQIGFASGIVTYQGFPIGQAFGGAGETLSILLNANASMAAVEALIENLTYANTSDVPTANRTLRINLADGAGAAAITPLAFAERTGSGNPLDGDDIGLESAPTFADLDDDGDLDALVGSGGGPLYYFENTGTASLPAFASAVANPFGLATVGNRSTPSFADLDADGDLDVMVGEFHGVLNYFQNTGSASAPAFAAAVTNLFPTNPGMSFTAPTFADLDADGDLDALVGVNDGNFQYFQNTGTASVPTFAGAVVDPFGLTAVGFDTMPSFADFDADGDFDVVAGADNENLYYFENTGTAIAPAFAAAVTNLFSAIPGVDTTAPSPADLDADGDLDFVAGVRVGFLRYFENVRPMLDIAINVTAEGDWPVKTFDFALVDATVSYSGNTVIIDGPSSHTVLTGVTTYIFTDGTVNEADGDPLVADLFYYSQISRCVERPPRCRPAFSPIRLAART